LNSATARICEVNDDERPWYFQWRFWIAGAVVLTVIWAVESLRKGDLMWPWPAVPLVIWAVVVRGARADKSEPSP
jgi:hypothetical protein